MVRKKDRFWECVEKQDNGRRFKCKFYECIFAGGATRIKSHLAEVIDHDIVICKKATKIVQEEAYFSLQKKKKKKRKEKKKLI